MTAGVRIARVWVPGRGASLGLCEGPEVRVPPASAGAPADSLDALCAES